MVSRLWASASEATVAQGAMVAMVAMAAKAATVETCQRPRQQLMVLPAARAAAVFLTPARTDAFALVNAKSAL